MTRSHHVQFKALAPSHAGPLVLAFTLMFTSTAVPSRATAPPGRAAAEIAFPDSAPGRIAAAFFTAYNAGGDDTMRRFYETHVSVEGLKRRSIAERLEILHEMRARQGRLTPLEVKTATETSAEVIVRNESGERVDFTFLCEEAPPHALMGIRVEQLPGAGDTGPGPGSGAEGGDSASAASQASAPLMTDPEIVGALHAHMESLRAGEEFSGVVLLAKGTTPLFREAYGLASRAAGTPNRPDTKFNLGSINKAFTRIAIEQLAKAGKLQLTDTVDRWVPEYPADKGRRITIGQLLEHRGGVGDIFGPGYEAADRSRLREIKDWIPLFRDEPLHFEPGTREEYSNGGYVLLGRVVETASGRNYYDYVRERIFAPAGMTDTDSFFQDRPVENRAIGYTRRDAHGGGEHGGDARGDGAHTGGASWRDASGGHPARGSSAGGGYSTADDLLRFAVALRDDKFGAGTKGGGLGIAGGSPGTNAALESIGGYTVVVLANIDPPAAERIASKIRGWLPRPGAGGPVMRNPAPGASVIRTEGPGGVMARSAGSPAGFPGSPGSPGSDDADARTAGTGPVVRRTGAADRPRQKPEQTIVPETGVDVPMLRSGHLPAVDVMVNGQGPFRFAIDTGGAGVARLSAALATKLGLETIGEVRAGDPSGKNPRVLRLVAMKTIDLGGARFTGLTGSVLPEDAVRLDEPVDGILGFGLFADCLFTLDYPASRVRLAKGELPPANGKETLSYRDPHGIPSITLRVGDLDVDADLDAGSMGGFSLPESLASKLKLASEPRVVGHARTLSSSFDIKAADLDGEIALGGYKFSRPTVEFQPAFPVANVGSRVLRAFVLTFDQTNRRVRLERAAGEGGRPGSGDRP